MPDERFRRVVVGLDDPPRPHEALAWARRVHEIDGAGIVLAHVLPQVLAPSFGVAYGMATMLEARAQRADEVRLALDEATGSLAQSAGIEAEATLATGTAPHELVEIARTARADLVIVGPHRGSNVGGALLGSTADAVRHRAQASVLLARGDPTLRRVLVPLDPSSTSRLALRHALRFARAASGTASVTILHVAEHLTARADLAPAESLLRDLGVPDAGGAHFEMGFGRAGEAILARAASLDADLIVMGSRGLGGGRSRLLGSVGDEVSRKASCSVLVVRPPREA